MNITMWRRMYDDWNLAERPEPQDEFEWRWEQQARAARNRKIMDGYHRQCQRRRAFEQLARELMDQHGLKDWYLGDLKDCRERSATGREFGGDCDKWGTCLQMTDALQALLSENLRPGQSQIFLAMDKASKKSLVWQRDLILHEIAHALAPPEESHGDIWATIAERIGVRRTSVMVHLAGAQHSAYCLRQRRIGNQAKAALQKRTSKISEAQKLTLIRRIVWGD
jgi:hypothetical protein